MTAEESCVGAKGLYIVKYNILHYVQILPNSYIVKFIVLHYKGHYGGICSDSGMSSVVGGHGPIRGGFYFFCSVYFTT